MDRVTQYAVNVLEGKEVAGDTVKLACERHLNDIKRSKTDDLEYYFDIDRANRIIDFAETLYIVEGMEDKEPLQLVGFQDFILGSLWGWVHKDTQYRRFRVSYVQLGRQQGKSILNGILGLYSGNFDGYKYPQIYLTATKQDQARIVLNEMLKMINADSDLAEMFNIKEYKSEIECLVTNGIIRALGRDTKSIDGFRPYLGVIDEYHAHKDNQMYKLLEGGTGNLPQSLISIITTAGFDLNSACFEMYEYSKNILKGVFNNEQHFAYIAELDEDDDIWDSKNWIKANPLTCRTEQGIKNLKTVARTAKDMQGNELRDFLTKRLNKWVQFGDDEYIKYEDWKKCGTDLTLEDFRGHDCIVGLDLSSGGDLTSLAIEIPYMEDGEKKYFIHSHSFIPKMRVQEHIKTDKVPYDIWINKGLLTVTETLGGVKTDYQYIISYLERVIEEYDLNLITIAYDPYNASAFLHDLDNFGVDLIEIRQSARNLSDATEDFELEVRAGNVTYNKENKLLNWSIGNAKLESNSFGEVKIIKDRFNRRIDAIDAVIDAHKIAMKQEGSVDLNAMTEEYLDTLEEMGW